MASRTGESHLWIIAGPAGCGKTTIALGLANEMGFQFLEGDVFHPRSNVDKMAADIPLTDGDRLPWLETIVSHSTDRLDQGAVGLVVSCSTLKRKYRDVFRRMATQRANTHVHFFYLSTAEDTILARVYARQGHFMKGNMVHGQFLDLELPSPDESDCTTIDASGPEPKVQEDVLGAVQAILRQSSGTQRVQETNAHLSPRCSEYRMPRPDA